MSHHVLIPCGDVATCIVDNGDEHPYFMCDPCARHNVVNRGAVRLEPEQARGNPWPHP